MKQVIKLFGIISIMAIIVFSITACPEDDPGEIPPEQLPDKDRWWTWTADDSTATISHSVDSDDVCTITVGGTAMTGQPAWDYTWKAQAGFNYTASVGKVYEFVFEAKTESGDRHLNIEWYGDNDKEIYHGTGFASDDWNVTPLVVYPSFKITSEWETYTITTSEPIPKSGGQAIKFQCANQTGTFKVKIISIKEYNQSGSVKIDNTSYKLTGGEMAYNTDWEGNTNYIELMLYNDDSIYINFDMFVAKSADKLTAGTYTFANTQADKTFITGHVSLQKMYSGYEIKSGTVIIDIDGNYYTVTINCTLEDYDGGKTLSGSYKGFLNYYEYVSWWETTFGDFYEHLEYEFPEDGIELDELAKEITKDWGISITSWEEFINQVNYIFYKDEDLEDEFIGTDEVDADTVVFVKSYPWWYDR